MTKIAAVVLAAGRGTRIKAKKINKVMLPLAGRPMIGYTIELLKKSGLKKTIIVVGFAKQLIIDYLGKGFVYAYQRERLGTAHAVKTALAKVPKTIKNILVINADDSAFYPPQVIKNLIKKHGQEKADLTFLTVEKKKPDIARVIRNSQGEVLGVVERQNLEPGQKKIKEINCGCYCFSIEFLRKFLPQVEKNPVSQEYYLTQLIELGIKNKAKVQVFKMDKEDYFQGINTKKQLLKADLKMKQKLK